MGLPSVKVATTPVNDTPAAVEVLHKAVMLFPDNTNLRMGRAVYLARLEQYDVALRDAEETLKQNRHPGVIYQAACIHAQVSRARPQHADIALRLLAQAISQGYGLEKIQSDVDLVPLQERDEFHNLLGHARDLQKLSQTPN